MSNPTKRDITIIGCGLAGCFLAIMLAKRGYRVNVYERLSKDEISNANSKRSFNLTLYGYAIEMLKEAGLWKSVKPHMLPLKGSSTQVNKDSQPIFSSVDHDEMPYYTISRARLVDILLTHAEKSPLVTIYYETALLSINRYDKTILVEDLTTKKITKVTCEVVLGADGVNSVVRPFLQQGQKTFHTQEYAEWSYKQFSISKKHAQLLNLKNDIAYTWSRKQAFIITFPNHDGSASGLLVLPKIDGGFASLQTINDVKNLIMNEFPVFLPVFADMSVSLLSNPEGTFVTIHTDPWYYKDFLAVIGDAAHGFYPFFGQGTSAAFGDCMQLIKLLDIYGTNWGKVFPLYQQNRKRHMDALGEVSKEGFRRYLRNKRADYAVIYDRLEQIGHSLLPNYIFPPLFLPVMVDPEHTADHVQAHTKQRRIAVFLGIPFFVALLTGCVAIQEKLDTMTGNKLLEIKQTELRKIVIPKITYRQAKLLAKPLIILLLSLLHSIS